MDFRARSQRDGRRRRVLLDEKRTSESSGVPLDGKSVKRSKSPYPPDALTTSQPRVTDFIPATPSSLAFIGLGIVAVDLLVPALHWQAPKWSEKVAGIPLDAFDASRRGSLADVVIAMQLLLAAVAAGMIATITRRRLDDYRGRYRAWISAAVVLPLVAFEQLVHLRDLIVFGIQHIPRMPVFADSRHYWSLLLLMLLGPITVQVLWYMRRSRMEQMLLAMGCLLTLIAPYITAIESLGEFAAMPPVTAKMLAASLIAFGCTAYARRVRNQAAGRMKKKLTKKVLEVVPDSPEQEAGTPTRLVGETPIPERTGPLGALMASARAKIQGSDLRSPDEDEDRPLSKAERKRQQRRAA